MSSAETKKFVVTKEMIPTKQELKELLEEGAAERALKVRENLARRRADRYGYRLKKSRSREPRAVDFGLWAIIDPQTGGTVNEAIAGRWICSWTLDEVEEWLNDDGEET